ncbi:serine/threonine-protein kinase TTK/MPS1 [Pancytospora philotis]|nr:serine/threonine-protein kinase TTK/MPS1 [Pancytospora philotis]
MAASPVPRDPAALLPYLRGLSRDDPQHLLTAYTQALAHLCDDEHSVAIFLDYVEIASGLSELEDVEHIFNLMKVKLRAHRAYWHGYIRFEVAHRKKQFDQVFVRMMEYLRVKIFPGKEALVEAVLKDRGMLLRELCPGAGRGAGCAETAPTSAADAPAAAVQTPARPRQEAEEEEEPHLSDLSDLNATFDLEDSVVYNSSPSAATLTNRHLDSLRIRAAEASTCANPAAPGRDAVPREKAERTISFLSKRLKEMSSNTESLLSTYEMLREEIGADVNEALGIKADSNSYEDGAAGDKENCSNAQKNAAFELDILDTMAFSPEKNGKLIFSPVRRDPYNPHAVAGQGKPAGRAEGAAPRPAPQPSVLEADEPELACDILEDTQNFRDAVRPVQFPTMLFKEREIVKICRIGKGGYSTVFKVLMGREVYALKQMRIDDPDHRKLCRDEIVTLKRLSHGPNVINMIDFEVTSHIANIVLEYGEIDLERIVKAGGLSLFYIKYLWQSILRIIVFIHQHRIIHRDIKPANFVLVKGRVKLIDFGISKSMKADTTSVLNIEKTGTLNYISPEQCTGGRVSRATDVWSSGCILYYMVYGRHIHDCKDVLGVLRVMSEERPIDFPAADALAVDSMRLCLQYDPTKRAKAAELLEHDFLRETSDMR